MRWDVLELPSQQVEQELQELRPSFLNGKWSERTLIEAAKSVREISGFREPLLALRWLLENNREDGRLELWTVVSLAHAIIDRIVAGQSRNKDNGAGLGPDCCAALYDAMFLILRSQKATPGVVFDLYLKIDSLFHVKNSDNENLVRQIIQYVASKHHPELALWFTEEIVADKWTEHAVTLLADAERRSEFYAFARLYSTCFYPDVAAKPEEGEKNRQAIQQQLKACRAAKRCRTIDDVKLLSTFPADGSDEEKQAYARCALYVYRWAWKTLQESGSEPGALFDRLVESIAQDLQTEERDSAGAWDTRDDVTDLLKYWAVCEEAIHGNARDATLFHDLLLKKLGLSFWKRPDNVPKADRYPLDTKYGLDVWLAMYGPANAGKTCMTLATGSLADSRLREGDRASRRFTFRKREKEVETDVRNLVVDWINTEAMEASRTEALPSWIARRQLRQGTDDLCFATFFDIGGEILNVLPGQGHQNKAWRTGVNLVLSEMMPCGALFVLDLTTLHNHAAKPQENEQTSDELMTLNAVIDEMTRAKVEKSVPVIILLNKADCHDKCNDLSSNGLSSSKMSPDLAKSLEECFQARTPLLGDDGSRIVAFRELEPRSHTLDGPLNRLLRSQAVSKCLPFAHRLRSDLRAAAPVIERLLQQGYWNILVAYTCCKGGKHTTYGLEAAWDEIAAWIVPATSKARKRYLERTAERIEARCKDLSETRRLSDLPQWVEPEVTPNLPDVKTTRVCKQSRLILSANSGNVKEVTKCLDTLGFKPISERLANLGDAIKNRLEEVEERALWALREVGIGPLAAEQGFRESDEILSKRSEILLEARQEFEKRTGDEAWLGRISPHYYHPFGMTTTLCAMFDRPASADEQQLLDLLRQTRESPNGQFLTCLVNGGCFADGGPHAEILVKYLANYAGPGTTALKECVYPESRFALEEKDFYKFETVKALNEKWKGAESKAISLVVSLLRLRRLLGKLEQIRQNTRRKLQGEFAERCLEVIGFKMNSLDDDPQGDDVPRKLNSLSREIRGFPRFAFWKRSERNNQLCADIEEYLEVDEPDFRRHKDRKILRARCRLARWLIVAKTTVNVNGEENESIQDLVNEVNRKIQDVNRQFEAYRDSRQEWLRLFWEDYVQDKAKWFDVPKRPRVNLDGQLEAPDDTETLIAELRKRADTLATQA